MDQRPKVGLVDIMGVTTRTNTSRYRRCTSCGEPIGEGNTYERVARLPGAPAPIESYDPECFEDDFGPREAYGD